MSLTQRIPCLPFGAQAPSTAPTTMDARTLIHAIYDADLHIACREEAGYCPDQTGLSDLIAEYERRFRCRIARTRSAGWLLQTLASRCAQGNE